MALLYEGGIMNKTKLKKVYSGKSRKEAVYLFCHECMGYDGHHSGVKKSHVGYDEAGRLAKECNAVECPLFPYRNHKLEPVEVP